MNKLISKFVTPLFETSSDYSEWFGYYNYDPLNIDHTKMLCHRSTHEGVAPEKGMTIELGYYDIPSGIWHRIGESDSWNWPQAAMLQWIPGKGNESRVIYNCSENNHNVAKIVNVETGEEKTVPWSIYGLTPDGKKSIAIDMERAHWCRTYHYQSVENKDLDVPIPENDGIFEIDLESNTRKLIVSIHDVISIDPDVNFQNLKHWLEHVMINPAGTKFAFLHRFSPVDSPMQYQTRLCIANIDGSKLQVVEGWRDYSLSHFGWKNDTDFCIYSVKIPALQKQFLSSIKSESKSKQGSLKSKLVIAIKNLIPKSVRGYLKGGASANFYQFYELIDGIYKPVFTLNKPAFQIDGHPSFSKDGKYMITDTYADKKGWRHLYVYSMETNKEVELARLIEPLVGNPARCDFHPKLSRDNNCLIIDTTYSGKHKMLLFSLNWDLILKEVRE